MQVSRRAVFALALFAVVGLAMTQVGEARKNGVSGRSVGGCTCHGNAVPWAGVAGQLPMQLNLEGVPEDYEPSKLYSLEVSVSGGFPYLKAGFNLNASAGTLSVPADESNVQITTKDTFGGVPGEATHKTPDSREWKVAWAAPREGAGAVIFTLAVNSVNGNDQPDAADQWNLLQAASSETNFAPRAPAVNSVQDREAGAVAVNWTPSPDLDIVRHELYAGPAGFKPNADTLLLTVENATDEELVANGLDAGAQYDFVLRAVDKGGLATDSLAVVAQLAPAPVPDNLNDTASKSTPKKDAPASAASVSLAALLAAFAEARRRRA